jgi:AraC-like DNA-binding protein
MHVIHLAAPALPLREFVRFYAHREVRTSGVASVHPVPARAFPILEFVFGDRIRVVYSDPAVVRMSPRAVVIGLQTHCRSELQFQGTTDCFVILFQPTGLNRLFSTPAQELTDRAYDAHSVLGIPVSRLEQMLGETNDFRQRARIADEFLLGQSVRARACERISAASGRILRASGNARIGTLAREAGVSVRQFERSFSAAVGVHPKLYARIVRFEAALDSKARSTKSWTEVAHEFGYYDQTHMVHDFQGFTGDTPTHMLKAVVALFRCQIEAIRSGRRSAAGDDLELIL